MEIDIKKSNNSVDYISTETTSKFDVNKLRDIEKVGSVYIMNEKNSVLTKKSETELKQYFTKSKNELISVLNEAIKINKNDYFDENNRIINEEINNKLSTELDISSMIRFKGYVTNLPDHPLNGEIYALNTNDVITYYLYLNGIFFAMISKSQLENNFYKKEVLNSKLDELNSKLHQMIGTIEGVSENAISKNDLNRYISKLDELKNQLNTILEN